jgi:hypothetical protein
MVEWSNNYDIQMMIDEYLGLGLRLGLGLHELGLALNELGLGTCSSKFQPR